MYSRYAKFIYLNNEYLVRVIFTHILLAGFNFFFFFSFFSRFAVCPPVRKQINLPFCRRLLWPVWSLLCVMNEVERSRECWMTLGNNREGNTVACFDAEKLLWTVGPAWAAWKEREKKKHSLKGEEKRFLYWFFFYY